jgi:hypothetical protein
MCTFVRLTAVLLVLGLMAVVVVSAPAYSPALVTCLHQLVVTLTELTRSAEAAQVREEAEDSNAHAGDTGQD